MCLSLYLLRSGEQGGLSSFNISAIVGHHLMFQDALMRDSKNVSRT